MFSVTTGPGGVQLLAAQKYKGVREPLAHPRENFDPDFKVVRTWYLYGIRLDTASRLEQPKDS